MPTTGTSNGFQDEASFVLMCFGAGTLVKTPHAETRIEDLAIGDPIMTAAGNTVPVKWIGRQTITKRFAGARARLVRISAGTLGTHADLFVTQDHGMVIDGLIVNAGALVNGTTISLVPLSDTPERLVVYHLETEAHGVILANGAATETYLDRPDRAAFDNIQEYLDLYGAEQTIAEAPLPRIGASRLVPNDLVDRLARSA